MLVNVETLNPDALIEWIKWYVSPGTSSPSTVVDNQPSRLVASSVGNLTFSIPDSLFFNILEILPSMITESKIANASVCSMKWSISYWYSPSLMKSRIESDNSLTASTIFTISSFLIRLTYSPSTSVNTELGIYNSKSDLYV